MKKEIFGGPRRTDAKATCAGRAGKRRTDPISTRRFFAKRSAEGSDGAKKKDREIDVGRLFHATRRVDRTWSVASVHRGPSVRSTSESQRFFNDLKSHPHPVQ